MGSGTTLREWLLWTFSPNIDFAYGDIKTLSFQAEAALSDGYYCNWVHVDPVDPNWRPGMQSAITVGNPSTTLCPGQNLKVDKTSSPGNIVADVPTPVTYTITIENIGDSSVSLDRIEDWLPTVGSSNPSDGFVYVDNSTSAYFNGTSDPVIFYDGFNRTDSNTVDYWTDGDGAGAAADCRVNTNRADLKLGCVITQSAISTDGYTNILFTYRWSGSDALSNRTLTVEWKPSSTSTWTVLANHLLNVVSYQNASFSLPASANNTTIDIRFTGNSEAGTGDHARIEDVKISAPAAAIAFDGFESGDGTGGTGSWNGNWTVSGNFRFDTGGPYQGVYHLSPNPPKDGLWDSP